MIRFAVRFSVAGAELVNVDPHGDGAFQGT